MPSTERPWETHPAPAGAAGFASDRLPPLDHDTYLRLATEIVREGPDEDCLCVLEETMRCFEALGPGERVTWDGGSGALQRDPHIGDVYLPVTGAVGELRETIRLYRQGQQHPDVVCSLIFALVENLRAEASGMLPGSWAYRWHCWQAGLLGRLPSPPLHAFEEEAVPPYFPIPRQIAKSINRLSRRVLKSIRDYDEIDADFAALCERYPRATPEASLRARRWSGLAIAIRAAARREARAYDAGHAAGEAAASRTAEARRYGDMAATTAAVKRAHDLLQAAQNRIEDLERQLAAKAAQPRAAGGENALARTAAMGAVGYLIGRKL